MSDTVEQLGKIITDPNVARDAIHIAVAPVTAAHALPPGQRVGFVEEGNDELVGAGATKLIGIIDPFLQEVVEPNQRCWLYLFPGSITSLRHEWTHTAFGPKELTEYLAKKEASRGS